MIVSICRNTASWVGCTSSVSWQSRCRQERVCERSMLRARLKRSLSRAFSASGSRPGPSFFRLRYSSRMAMGMLWRISETCGLAVRRV